MRHSRVVQANFSFGICILPDVESWGCSVWGVPRDREIHWENHPSAVISAVYTAMSLLTLLLLISQHWEYGLKLLMLARATPPLRFGIETVSSILVPVKSVPSKFILCLAKQCRVLSVWEIQFENFLNSLHFVFLKKKHSCQILLNQFPLN